MFPSTWPCCGRSWKPAARSWSRATRPRSGRRRSCRRQRTVRGCERAEARLLAGRAAAGQAVRLLADLAEVVAEPAAFLAEGAGVLPQVQGLLDELAHRGGPNGPGVGKVSHAVASFRRATLPSPSTYQVGRRF